MGRSVGTSYGRVLDELLSKEELRSFVKCIREWILADRGRVCHGNICVMFGKSGWLKAALYSTLNDYDLAANKVTISQTENCEIREQRLSASLEFCAKIKLSNSSVVV